MRNGQACIGWIKNVKVRLLLAITSSLSALCAWGYSAEVAPCCSLLCLHTHPSHTNLYSVLKIPLFGAYTPRQRKTSRLPWARGVEANDKEVSRKDSVAKLEE